MGETEHFDVIVVGSGFGGSVMSYRAAEAGLSVCLFERGKAYPPGSFPRNPGGYRTNFWDPSQGLHGMFNVWAFDDLEAVVSSGLGGGSLIYANVLIRKDPKWFVRDGFRNGVYEYWPVSYDDLETHYERAEKMLGATPYPLEHAPYDRTTKTIALRAAAERLGKQWYLPNLAVTFGNDPREPRPGEPIEEERRNYHGSRNRSSCRLCGECDVGCNYGSKNSLDFNYLTQAWHHGADIRTRCEVRNFWPLRSGGYGVSYVVHEGASEGQPTDTRALPLRTATANRLVLSAGTFGSTYLMLKNAGALPGLSPTLGSRFCGNGDFLAFIYTSTDVVAGRRLPHALNPNYGTVITSTIRGEDAADGGAGRGFYLQDAGYPEWVSWLVEASQVPAGAKRLAKFALHRLSARLGDDPNSDLGHALADLVGDARSSSGSMPLLGMGRDAPDGKMSLRKQGERSFLKVDWQDDKSSAHFARVRETAREVSDALGGLYVESPLVQFFNRLITVHPLGGCPIGRNANEGTVDTHGQVFGWPGLYVADGAVMPGPVGANPSLTIAALADRFADHLVASH